MSWLRRLLAHFRADVAKPREPVLPPATQELIDESKAVRRDLRELRRFEIIVRKR